MKVFISDLHLGDGSKTDDFHRDKAFLEFLEFIEKQARELIIVGDFFELWQADLDRVLFRHSEVISRLLALRKTVKITYVVGNHDYIPFAKFTGLDAGICLEYHDAESGLIAEHGYRYDIFNRYKNPLRSLRWPPGKHIAVFIGGLERFLHPDIDTWAKNALEGLEEFLQDAVRVRNKVTPSMKAYLNRGGHFGEFEEAVRNHIEKGAKIVVFGHTHKAQLEAIAGGVYANCGTWVDNTAPTYIAYHKGKIELKEALTHTIIKQILF